MRPDVAQDLSDSAYDFTRAVWPAIRDLAGGGRIEPVETTATEDFRRDLDVLAGIDAWQVVSDQGMRGIASRVQWIDPPLQRSWRTFTIRARRPSGAETELAKRLRAFLEPDRGWLLPHLTIQAYLSKPKRQGSLIAAAVIRTSDLYESVVKNGPSSTRTNPRDGVEFHAYLWDDLRRNGYRVSVAEPGVLAA